MATVALRAGDLPAPARMRFVATIFAGSFLLFLVQPMIARMALPRLGGAPSVWNSAMLVYQLLLLAGYAYSHWLGRLAPRSQAGIHLTAFVGRRGDAADRPDGRHPACRREHLPLGAVAAAAPRSARCSCSSPPRRR